MPKIDTTYYLVYGTEMSVKTYLTMVKSDILDQEEDVQSEELLTFYSSEIKKYQMPNTVCVFPRRHDERDVDDSTSLYGNVVVGICIATMKNYRFAGNLSIPSDEPIQDWFRLHGKEPGKLILWLIKDACNCCD